MLKMKDLAKELRQYRKQRGITQEDLGAIVGVKRNTITRWESGKVKISRVYYKMLHYEGIV